MECPDSIPVEDFVTNACRPCTKAIKSMNLLFDTHLDANPCGAGAELGQHIAESNWDSLPAAIQLKASPPHGSKVDFIQVAKPNGNVDMLKVIYLPRPLSFQLAAAICKGDVYVPVHRLGPWNIKKGIQWLPDRLGGYQVRWHHLQDKASAVSDSKPSWCPSNAELEEGVVFINTYAPECDAQNQQTLWILINIKPDSGTPIAGWPEPKVRHMCQNKSKGLGGAMSMTDFPLNTCSLKPFLHKVLLLLVYPLLLHFGVLLLGSPGVGKTPFVIILAIPLGKYHVRQSGDEGFESRLAQSEVFGQFPSSSSSCARGIVLG